jgi:hypothetical protein
MFEMSELFTKGPGIGALVRGIRVDGLGPVEALALANRAARIEGVVAVPSRNPALGGSGELSLAIGVPLGFHREQDGVTWPDTHGDHGKPQIGREELSGSVNRWEAVADQVGNLTSNPSAPALWLVAATHWEAGVALRTRGSRAGVVAGRSKKPRKEYVVCVELRYKQPGWLGGGITAVQLSENLDYELEAWGAP